jgi:hypothetical protein
VGDWGEDKHVGDDGRIRIPDELWPLVRPFVPDAASEPVLTRQAVEDAFSTLHAGLARAARLWRPRHSPTREDRWTRRVRRACHIEIDDDDLVVVATAMFWELQALMDRSLGFLRSLTDTLSDIPDSGPMMLAALVNRPLFEDGRLPDVLELLGLARRAEALRMDLVRLRARVPELQRPSRLYRDARTFAGACVRVRLAERHPQGKWPQWAVVAAVLWFHGWRINPDDAKAVKVLTAEFHRWYRTRPDPLP